VFILTNVTALISASTVQWYSSDIGPSTILPWLWAERVLFPCLCASVHSRHNVKMGHGVRPEAYSKVSPSTLLSDISSVANTASSAPRWKITGLPLVPSMIHQLVNSAQWANADTSSVETVGSGAASLPPDLHAKFQAKLKSTLFQGYGSSESVCSHPSASAVLGRFIC
jgi:acyl-CoA synthetase (AMP-forming)/AMP-acid ligase II